MRLSGISGFTTTNFCASKGHGGSPEPKVHNPHRFQIEKTIDSYGGVEYYIDGSDENGKQVATFIKFNNESTKTKQKILNEALKNLREPRDTFEGYEAPVDWDALADCKE